MNQTPHQHHHHPMLMAAAAAAAAAAQQQQNRKMTGLNEDKRGEFPGESKGIKRPLLKFGMDSILGNGNESSNSSKKICIGMKSFYTEKCFLSYRINV